jgi:hypothetical protein
MQGHFYPFLYQLYANQVPIEDQQAYVRLHQVMNEYARDRMTLEAIDLRQHLTESGVIPCDDHRPLAVVACDFCLCSEIQHVLVGMRNIKYVEALKDLFWKNASEARPQEIAQGYETGP